MFKIDKPRHKDIEVGTTHCKLVYGSYSLFQSCWFMLCCVHDHKPRHACGICIEVAFRDVIFPPSYSRDDHHPEWRLMPFTSSHYGKITGALKARSRGSRRDDCHPFGGLTQLRSQMR